MQKVAFYTLGCKLNFSETSAIGRQFEAKGFRRVDFDQAADFYVINTCSVTENADRKCKKVVKEAKRNNPDSTVVVIGCYAQLKPQEIVEIPGVDAVLGAAEKFTLLEKLPQILEAKAKPVSVADGSVLSKKIFVSEIKAANTFTASYSIGDRTRTFLKVQDGCNYHCSFCTIPLARGNSRSDSIANIVRQAEEIARTEVKEIVLTGVNIGDFGIRDGKRTERFFELVQALDAVEGIERFRISSIEPNLLNNDIIGLVAESKRFMPHFHIPLQSGSDSLLEKMRRRYRTDLYANRIERIKTLMPHCCVGVDVIVGFPGETEALFQETYSFLNDLPISYLHVFPYSERANTHAIELEGAVPMGLRKERVQRLRMLSEKKRAFFYREHLGQIRPTLFEAEAKQGRMQGFTDNYIRVEAAYDPLHVNETKEVRLVAMNEAGNVEIADTEVDMLPLSVHRG